MKKRPRISAVAGALAGILLLVSLLYSAVAGFTFNIEHYPQTAAYQQMAGQLIDYLRGVAWELAEPFTVRESLHMADVRVLFQGGKALALGCGSMALMLGSLALLWGDRVQFTNGTRTGVGIFWGMLVIVGVWAAVDFEGWFTAMHRVAFTNDLWLLDPAESQLIQMLPQSFFENAVWRIARMFLMFSTLVLGASIAIEKLYKKKE